ncbi:tryptophan-rich sensory protein [Erythrobacter insulae]|uniref:Tryptophan-rich sensory protein n=1 Tax=Erythrobacter insulae TaxID=2584124 RepID=A0A547P787_9SPHN|nr:TspO/MBR family protein [Erythrobacter insulae]TRD09884.1 tryptophan-rich sensory protein [Erythrobacter insulae]
MDWTVAIIAALWAIILGGAGGALTEIGEWYRNLNKPSWQPPDWLFGPAWTVILGLSGWSFYEAMTNAATIADTYFIGGLFLANFLAHLAWSPLFFKIKRPDWALFENAFLWASVLSLCVFLPQYSALAGWLNLPYIAWVSFAVLLNWKIVQLNGPFGAKTAS